MPAKFFAGGNLLTGTLNRWSATLIANILSTYALDAVATLAGLLLVASKLLAGLDVARAGLVLAISYVFWGCGLSSSLSANWRLLEATGTSTSVLSKLTYDLTALHDIPIGVRRLATGAGYVMVELVKELPYYFGIFGLALATDIISAPQAFVFLAGTNLGAAAYEFGLGWSTRSLLRRAASVGHPSFGRRWAPADYLARHYGAVNTDQLHTIAFFSAAARHMPANEPALVVGNGPTLHHVFLMAERASQIHLGDVLRPNLDEVRRWLLEEEGAHDWQPFVAYTLQCEGSTDAGASAIATREALTRAKITRLVEVDIDAERPSEAARRSYATVLTAYCVRSPKVHVGAWQISVRRAARLVRPGGTLLVAALGQTRGVLFDGKPFRGPRLDEQDLSKVLLDYFAAPDLSVRTVHVPECAARGYTSIILGVGHNRLAGREQRGRS